METTSKWSEPSRVAEDRPQDTGWTLAGMQLQSRLLVGTARYPSTQVLLDALRASGTELVTVGIRRVSLTQGGGENLYQLLRERGYRLLPNTAGCFSARDAVLTAELAREALGTTLVKLEVIGDQDTLLPDIGGLLQAADELVRRGFQVLPYSNDDPETALRLQDAGCSAVMPLGAPIGSGQGILHPERIEKIVAQARVPIIVDAGVGTASDVAIAFELGCHAVLLNTAIARARRPVSMAAAMRVAAQAGRLAYGAGRMPRRPGARVSTSHEGRIGPEDR